jgi:hypothetical protein
MAGGFECSNGTGLAAWASSPHPPRKPTRLADAIQILKPDFRDFISHFPFCLESSSAWDQDGPIAADNDHATLLQFHEQLLVSLNLSVVLVYLLDQLIYLLLVLLIP